MNAIKPLKINHFHPQSRQKVLSSIPLLSSKDLILEGTKFDYYQYDTYETPIHNTEHHVVSVVYSQIDTKRKLNGIYRDESQNYGSVGVIPAQVEHWVAWKEKLKFAVFSIQPQALKEIAPESINPDKIELIPAFAKSEPDPLIASIGIAIQQQLESDSHGCEFYLEHLFNALLAHLVQNYCSTTPLFKEYTGGLPKYKLKQAIEYINDNLDKSIKVTDIAKLVDISQYYFCRLFHDSTGVTPYQFVIRQRVTKTKDLLKNSKLALVDIALECGFSSQSQMTQHFRKSVGVTPKVYRNKL